MTPCCEIFPSTIQSNHRTFPALCAQVPQNSQPSFHTSTAPSASAMRSIPCHTMALHFVSAFYSQLVFFHICTWSPCQPNPASPNMPSHCAYIYIYISTFIYIYICIHIIYIYTHIHTITYFIILSPCSLLCAASQTASPIRSSHMPRKKRWVGGTRAVALLITMVYNTCN